MIEYVLEFNDHVVFIACFKEIDSTLADKILKFFNETLIFAFYEELEVSEEQSSVEAVSVRSDFSVYGK